MDRVRTPVRGLLRGLIAPTLDRQTEPRTSTTRLAGATPQRDS